MNRNDIIEKVNEIFHDVFDDESIVITDSMTAADIEDWDSLTNITLVLEIEKLFNYKFNLKEVLGFRNVGDMLDVLEKHCTGEGN